jgi:hypothetical protein
MLHKIISIFSKDASFDASLGLPLSKEFNKQLKNKHFNTLETIYNEANWAARSLIIDGATESEKYLSEIEEWYQTTKSANATLFIGAQNVILASHARSYARADELTEEQVDGFFHYLQIAHDYLLEAIDLSPNDSETFVQMMIVLRGFSADLEVIESYYNAAIDLCPENISAYLQMASALNPKWLGSLEQMYDFAEKMEVKRYPMLAQIMLFTLSEHHLYFHMNEMEDEYNNFYQRADIKAKVMSIFKQFKTPNSGKEWLPCFHNYMAFNLYMIGELDLAKNELSKCNFQGTLMPWGLIGVEDNRDLKNLF